MSEFYHEGISMSKYTALLIGSYTLMNKYKVKKNRYGKLRILKDTVTFQPDAHFHLPLHPYLDHAGILFSTVEDVLHEHTRQQVK